MKKDTFKKVGLEMLSVVFAVLLALGLNHWREERGKQQASDRALTNILIELYQNKQELEGELEDYQNKLEEITLLKSQIENGEKETGRLGYSMPLFSSAAWEVANTTGSVDKFDLDFLIELYQVYSIQDIYHENSTTFFNTFSTIEANKDENYKALVNANIRQLKTSLSLSANLLAAYDELFDNHDFIQEYLPDSLKTNP